MNVTVDEDCSFTSGTWTGACSGNSLDDAWELDIDHVVPPANAWRSGGSDRRVTVPKTRAGMLSRYVTFRPRPLSNDPETRQLRHGRRLPSPGLGLNRDVGRKLLNNWYSNGGKFVERFHH